MADDRNKILAKMLERLYASLTTGPVLNCRPHSSRQRIDLAQVARLDASTPESIVARLLGDACEAKLQAAAAPPASVAREKETDAERATRHAWETQQSLLAKLRTIIEDAKTYEQDTGSQVLYVGYPLLNLPPDSRRGAKAATAKRVVAPIAFIPIKIAIRSARPQTVTISAAGDGADRVIPNVALLAWVEQQTGKKIGDLFVDEEGTQPWREINELVSRVCDALEMLAPDARGPQTPLHPVPRSDAEDAREPSVVESAVLGLFPVSNQNLLRDFEAFVEGEAVSGPLESFLRVGIGLGRSEAHAQKPRDLSEERLVTAADPCQARAVRLARSSKGLVIHGPPGTGKSQTIANVVGDHLARGERVLFVCDKRTALDVVHHRLSRLGIGHLCAIVHDAQRDQRELYKSIREQLDALPESKTNPAALSELAAVDAELAKVHAELDDHHRALSTRPASGAQLSLHELAGEWFALDVPSSLGAVDAIHGTSLAELLPLEREARELFERSLAEDFPKNPWSFTLAVSLDEYLAKPVDHWRSAVERVHHAARAADSVASVTLLPFDPAVDPIAQGDARAKIGEKLAPLVERDAAMVARWAAEPRSVVTAASTALASVAPHIESVQSAADDAELAVVVRAQPVAIGQLVVWLAKIAAYLAISRVWYRFFCFGRKRAAREVLERFGLALGAAAAERVAQFLGGVRARSVLRDCHERLLAPGAKGPELADEALLQSLRDHADLFETLASLTSAGPLGATAEAIRERLTDRPSHGALLDGLAKSPERARAIVELEASVTKSTLFSETWCSELATSLRAGEPALPLVLPLEQRLATLEGILRIRRVLAKLPPTIAHELTRLAELGADVESGWSAIRKGVLAGEIVRRVQASPTLQELDGDRIHAAHESHRALDERKRALVRDVIQHTWTSRQRARLLASTGSRLNGAGADLRRRLTLRGEHALRVRQVIAAGADTDGGDPLFDVRPVWMASPETVAQIFPRKALFDVVVFDEASQCRLEEALPVLSRAKRVVIAGDPKQLPPTRFFESAVVQSHDDDGDASEQGLFEDQQSDIEDLLAGALNLEIEQCYLDVHYRSQNADLIEFSNKSFYESRLQPLPGHPRHRAKHPPLELVRVNGVYDKRANVLEAAAVVRVVRDLLARPAPPSIGIACFNLVQRDAIVEALDDAAAGDAEFGARLAAARTREGTSSFEGLFVKNLENVQGDERDHMIISTTYGPDPKGRFYRRFGPLALAGGGRRLNVLVTRARQAVHLVTSIPRELYASLAPVDAGQTPNGAWLLFSYLAYAERLVEIYAAENARLAGARVADKGTVTERSTSTPSKLARALADQLGDARGISSDVHWGNDGFCVDVALHHPTRAEDVSIGVLCDGARYDRAEDAVEWDLFRTGILRSHGWELVRLWSPQLFRDPARALETVTNAADAAVAKETPAAASPEPAAHAKTEAPTWN